MAKDCTVAIREVDEYEEEAAISWVCIIDEETNVLNVSGEWEAIPEEKSEAAQAQDAKGIEEDDD